MHANAATFTPAANPDRKSEKSEQTRQKLLEAGIHLFSTFGYSATSTRSVESHAEVQRNLISYHFGSKEEFWKACMDDLFSRVTRTFSPAYDLARDIEAGERIRFLIRQFVRMSAAHPEVMRIMFDEGRCDDWRLEWIVERYTRDFHRTVCQLFDDGQACGVIPDLSVMQFYYILVSSGSIFAMAPECRLLSDEEPGDEAMVDAHAEAIVQLLTRRTNGSES